MDSTDACATPPNLPLNRWRCSRLLAIRPPPSARQRRRPPFSTKLVIRPKPLAGRRALSSGPVGNRSSRIPRSVHRRSSRWRWCFAGLLDGGSAMADGERISRMPSRWHELLIRSPTPRSFRGRTSTRFLTGCCASTTPCCANSRAHCGLPLQDPYRMTETRAGLWRSHAWLVALAALALAGCSSIVSSTATSQSQPTPAASTRSPVPTATVTVTPAPAPTPAPVPTAVAQQASHSTFQSPSGTINCMMYASGGETGARCEVVDHTWAAPPRSPDCPLNWGDRFYLTQGGDAGFGCYHQEFPTAERTFGYGQTQSLGTLTCESEPTGMTCTDSSTGHYFRVAREIYELG